MFTDVSNSMPFVDLSELKDRANAARSSLSTRIDGVKTSAQTSYRKHNAAPSSESELPSGSGDKPNFANPAEKQALFSLLDTYFTRRGYQNLPHASSSHAPVPVSVPRQATPLIKAAARPTAAASTTTTTTSAAADSDSEAYKLAQFFLPSTSWSSYPEWFAFDRLPSGSQPTPPPLANRDVIRSSSWSYHGAKKTVDGIALFEDLSITWYHLTWTGDPRTVKREARWSNPPDPWNGADLYAASMMYGDLLAEFAEDAERSRQWIGRGECWDLANEGLKSVGERIEQSGGPKPMPCIGRTHGHLIFTAIAGKTGTWRGGENAIRRGDVVQWLKVKIKPLGQPHVTVTLGEPDHTAIVVSDTAVAGLEDIPETDDGLRALDAACIGSLEVIEQSVRELPTRRTYDMSQFASGQVSNMENCTVQETFMTK